MRASDALAGDVAQPENVLIPRTKTFVVRGLDEDSSDSYDTTSFLGECSGHGYQCTENESHGLAVSPGA